MGITSEDKAQSGLRLIKEAILETLAAHPDGLANAEIADLLDIRSDYLGKQQDYLSWSILGLLLNEKRIMRTGRKYFVNGNR